MCLLCRGWLMRVGSAVSGWLRRRDRSTVTRVSSLYPVVRYILLLVPLEIIVVLCDQRLNFVV